LTTSPPHRLRKEDLEDEAPADRRDEEKDEPLHLADAEALDREEHEDVERGDDHARHEGDAEQQVEADRGAENLGEVARRDRDLAEDPERVGDGARVGVAAGLRKVPPRDDAETGAEGLEENRDEVRHEENPDELIAEP
jgi:hypothetical protein